MTPGRDQVNNNGVTAELPTQTETINFNREPPPPYTELEVTELPIVNQPIIQQTIIVQVPLQNTPMYYNCNICREQILTRVEYVNTQRTHMLAGFICGLTCWCMLCCLGALPYIISTFKKAKHYCPICGQFLGECRKFD